jgi:cobalt-zinc-cadmium efflux system outer membrane protein
VAVVAAWLAAQVTCAGCGGTPAVVRTGNEISRALQLRDAIRFETHGQPDDAGAEPPGELTLQDAIERSLRNDPQIQIALSHVRAAEADLRQASLLPNPVLSVAFRYSNIHEAPIADVSLAGDLLALLERPRREAAAESRLRAASAEALGAALDVMGEVQQHYAGARAIEQTLEVLRQRDALNQKLLELARLRLEAGEGTRLDVITFETERVGLEVETAQQRADLRTERLALARLLGRPSSEAGWALTTQDFAARLRGDEREWVAAALARRPEVRAGGWELKALGDEAAVASLGVFQGSEIGATAERDGHWTAGPSATVPVPLFDWGQAKSARANADQVAARHKLTKVRRQVIEEVRAAYASALALQAAADRVRDELIPLQQRRREQAEAAYRAGETDLATMLQAEQDLQAANVTRIDLGRKAALALFKFQRAVGGPAVSVESAASAAAP